MVSEWTFTAPILSLQENFRFAPLKNKHYQSIIKYCTSKDDKGLILYLQNMLNMLSVDKTINYNALPVIDQFLLLVRIRSLSIGTRIELTFDSQTQEKNDDEEPNLKYVVLLADIQKSINKNYLQPVLIDKDGIKIKIHYPSTWDNPSIGSYIKEISIENTLIKYDDLTATQQQNLLDNLPRDIHNELSKSINNLVKSVNKMIFLETDNDSTTVRLDYSTLKQLMRTLYTHNIMNFVEQMYVFVKLLNMSLTDVMKLTPTDTNIYYQMYIKEMNEREKQSKQAAAKSTPSRNVPMNK